MSANESGDMMVALILLSVMVFSRFFLNPLLYFFVVEGCMIFLVVTRRRYEFWLLILSMITPISTEAVALFAGIGTVGHIFGTLVSSITMLLGLIDEIPRERLIRRINLKGRSNRSRVQTLMFTFGEVSRLEKLQMSPAHVIVSAGRLYFTLKLPYEGETLMSFSLNELKETAVHQVISENKPYYPRLRDLFIPVRNVRSIGKPRHYDYFLVIKTADNVWTFYEEPKTLLNFQKEIEEAMKKRRS
ncbi:hypothetical protein [Kosmotoga pacifica]|nr:hypothetical protein [Kosmotoga pacifica]